jgi:hypothetical protein
VRAKGAAEMRQTVESVLERDPRDAVAGLYAIREHAVSFLEPPSQNEPGD